MPTPYAQDYFHGSDGAALTARTPTDSAGSALSGLSWQANSTTPLSVPTISGNDADCTGLCGVTLQGGVATPDQDVAWDLKVTGTVGGSAWIGVAVSSDNKSYTIGYSGGSWEIRKWTGGVNSTQLAGVSAGTIAADKAVVLERRVVGADVVLTGKVDGATVLGPVTDVNPGSPYLAAGYPCLVASSLTGSKVARVAATNIVTALTAGSVAQSGGTDTTIALALTGGVGGSGTVVNKLYRSTTPGVLGTLIATDPGASYTDAGRAQGAAYYYTLTATDGGGAGATATGAQAAAGTTRKRVRIVLLGDSTAARAPGTNGLNGTYTLAHYLGGLPPGSALNVPAGQMTSAGFPGLAQLDNLTVTVDNQAVSGAATADFAPGGAYHAAAMAAIVAALASGDEVWVVVLLGINDAAAGVAAGTFGSRLAGIAAAALACTSGGNTPKGVFISAPIYWTAASGGAALNAQTLQYLPVIAALDNGTTIRTSTGLYHHSARHATDAVPWTSGPDDGHFVVHGSQQAAIFLAGEFRAKADGGTAPGEVDNVTAQQIIDGVLAGIPRTGYKLAADGLDSVVVETNLNARQALSVACAAAAGVITGADGSTVTIKGAGVATTRILATVGAGGRSAVALSPPT